MIPWDMKIKNDCDVIVVGAGPAGSAAANYLARAGFDVILDAPENGPVWRGVK